MKKILALVLAMAMVMSLVACGGNKDTKDPDPKPNQEVQSGLVENTPSTEITPEPEKQLEVVEPEFAAYITNEDMSGYTELTSLNHTRFSIPTDIYNDSTNMMEYLGIMMAVAFAGMNPDMTAEEQAELDEMTKILEKPAIMETPDAFIMMDAVNTATLMIATSENTEGTKIEDIDAEFLNGILEETDSSDTDIFFEEDAEMPNDPATEAEIPEAEVSTDIDEGEDVLLIAPNPNAGAAKDTEGAEDGDIIVDSVLTTGTEEAGETNPAEQLIIGEPLVKTEDKLIAPINGLVDTTDAEGNEIQVEVAGYVTVVIKDGYIVTAAYFGIPAEDGGDWMLTTMRSIVIDIENPGMSEEEYEQSMSSLFGMEVEDEDISDASEILVDDENTEISDASDILNN